MNYHNILQTVLVSWLLLQLETYIPAWLIFSWKKTTKTRALYFPTTPRSSWCSEGTFCGSVCAHCLLTCHWALLLFSRVNIASYLSLPSIGEVLQCSPSAGLSPVSPCLCCAGEPRIIVTK